MGWLLFHRSEFRFAEKPLSLLMNEAPPASLDLAAILATVSCRLDGLQSKP